MKSMSLSRFHIFSSLCLSLCIIFSSCLEKDEPQPENNSRIVSFTLKNADSTVINATIKIKTDTIIISLPAGSNMNLVPSVGIKGEVLEPASGVLQDFSSPLKYKVTAENGTFREYVVKVNLIKVLYIGTGSDFYALDAGTGALIWKHTGGNFIYSDPLLRNGIVYAGCASDGKMYAFDAYTGIVKWQQYLAEDGIECGPAIGGNTLFVGANDDNFYALDLATGIEKWHFMTGGNISSTPLLTDNKVIFGSSDANVYALDTASGAFIWTSYGNEMVNQSAPALSNGVVFIGSRDGNLKAMDVNTGKTKWSYYTGVSLEMSSPSVANGIVYIAGWYYIPDINLKGSLYAVDENTGELVWHSLDNLAFSSNPVIADGIVYVSADDGIFYAVKAATGDILWQYKIYANASGSGAAVSGNTVYVGGGGTGYIYAFDRKTGSIQWQYHIENNVSSSTPAIERKRKPRFAAITL